MPTLSGLNYTRASTLSRENAEVTELLEEYMEFSNVFSKNKAKQLPPHCDYDLSIQIEGDVIPPLGPIYSLSAIEQKTLHEFIDENLKSGVIRPLNSLCGSLVLFIRKKDGLLRLCANYRGLNRITYKDCYPIPLVSDLLDAPKGA